MTSSRLTDDAEGPPLTRPVGYPQGRPRATSRAAAERIIEQVTTVVIGAGHAGLATSRCLSERSIDHVVLERGEVANSWRRERWDSLRLLTPNWQSRLPGHRYEGPDPDGFMTMAEVIAFVSRFADAVCRAGAHAHHGHVGQAADDGYHVATTSGEFPLPLASCLRAAPATSRTCLRCGRRCRHRSSRFTPFDYRNPGQLPEGGVLIVGASATGVQLADEIQRSGRPVTLSVGEHVRLPRTYRGRDVLWWMDASGIWNQRYDEFDDLTRARRLPSPQLVGTPERTTLDLNALSAAGVEIVGRLATVRDGRALFSGGLRNQFALADLKMDRLLDTFDEWARRRPRKRRCRSCRALRADPRAGLVTTRARSSQRRNPLDRLGDRLSARITAGSTFRCSTRRATCATRAGLSRRRGSTRSDFPFSADASRPSSTARKTMLARWSITSPATSPAGLQLQMMRRIRPLFTARSATHGPFRRPAITWLRSNDARRARTRPTTAFQTTSPPLACRSNHEPDSRAIEADPQIQ